MHTDKAIDYLASDNGFDNLFPVHIQKLSAVHWTPLNVAAVASRFLAPDARSRVLDIGAGVGKFCIAGSLYTKGTFTGIEQRKNFVNIGNKVIQRLGVQRASLAFGNFLEFPVADFTGIYFFNSFHENLVLSDALDNKIEMSEELYKVYSAGFIHCLLAMPVGTRLATFWLSIVEIPDCYRQYESHFNDLLKLWVKER